MSLKVNYFRKIINLKSENFDHWTKGFDHWTKGFALIPDP